MSRNICEDLSTRPLRRDDVQFLERMAYLASYSINGNMLSIAPPFDEYRTTIGRVYTENWGREGDYGLLAINEHKIKIGAAWYRNYAETELPPRRIELAVEPEHQVRKGVGTILLRRLLYDAELQGLENIHLTVDEENTRAKSLYAKLGFVTIKRHYNLEIMRTDLGITHLPEEPYHSK